VLCDGSVVAAQMKAERQAGCICRGDGGRPDSRNSSVGEGAPPDRALAPSCGSAREIITWDEGVYRLYDDDSEGKHTCKGADVEKGRRLGEKKKASERDAARGGGRGQGAR
jgi:hypothetical protein